MVKNKMPDDGGTVFCCIIWPILAVVFAWIRLGYWVMSKVVGEEDEKES